jgi:hypothetical protein
MEMMILTMLVAVVAAIVICFDYDDWPDGAAA